MSAPITSRFLMIPREIPKYLATAYSVKYSQIEKNENIFKRSIFKIYRFILLAKEIIFSTISFTSSLEINKNIKRLQKDFDEKNKNLKDISSKDICVYLVGSVDNPGGAILGNHLYYYHHYKIKNFEKYFDVAAKVIKNNKDITSFLEEIKSKYPTRNIKVMDIVCHGCNDRMFLGDSFEYKISDVKNDEFKAMSQDGAIILDACSTAQETSSQLSIARQIAKKNPFLRIFAPKYPLFFSKPLINKTTKRIENVVHGFAIFKAFTCETFRYEREIDESAIPDTGKRSRG
ncbi:MAG: hypothetical protein KR126chlam5_00490 [Candidatus Anoxychlamydiales bacterium]|nr:hypothetical protein [Candidatus Anoxychlamydiales bacterium]